MSFKLVDVQCQHCKKVVADVLVPRASVEEEYTDVECEDPCDAKEKAAACGPFKVVVGVARHSKHSSWEVR